ncbi:hypothetical protein CARUB_v10006300mg [Capsella rubella]|uniref:RING-type domain-containing protein n=1 Tax=Capsella rubella TaxID=81985 RepID=R0F8E4_9BRAS|nr:hypothetical protein CARUB_v10006300mg [Capsella rubella]
MATKTCKIVYNETKTYANDLNDDISFILRIIGLRRIYTRSTRNGRETLVQQTDISMEKNTEFEFKIPPDCLVTEKRCRGLVDILLKFHGIPDRIRQCAVPSIYKEAMELSRYREEIGGRGFLIVTQVGVIEETWISDDDDSEDEIRTEQDVCSICLEALGEVRNTMNLVCSHSFHKDCIFQWLYHNLSCPICRYDDI